MQIKTYLRCLNLAVLFLLPPTLSCAMNLNLASPFDDKPSPPQTTYLSFFSRQSDDMLFVPASLKDKKSPLRIICQSGLRAVGLKWSLHRNMVNKPFRQGQAGALPANQFQIDIAREGLLPGFYDLKVTLDTGMTRKDGKPVTGVCVFGWQAAQMPLRETRPANFKEFWAAGKAKMAATPLDARLETPLEKFGREQINAYNLANACLPADYDPAGHVMEEVESAKVSFAGPDGGRVYAWLAKPKGLGPFPTMLVLPGAGFNARPRPLEHARHGYLTIDIQVHGQDVDLADYPKLPGYYSDPQFEPVQAYYYYKVHLRVLQAINYLASRPDVDAKRIVIAGGSQGGRLGIVAAALDSRIAAVVSCIANSPNYPHLAWVARCNGLDKPGDNPWDPKFKGRPTSDGMDIKDAPPATNDAEGRSFAYYDPMNFAPDVKCPVLLNAGLIDPVSPPFSVWAVYNRLGTKDKTIVPLPGLGHDWSAEFDRRAWRWLDQRLENHKIRMTSSLPSSPLSQKTLPPQLKRVVLLGDSITDGVTYPLLLEQAFAEAGYAPPVLINAGIGGNRAADMDARLDRDVIARRPTLVLVSAGVNDSNNVEAKAYEASMVSILDKLKARNISVVLLTPSLVRVEDQADDSKSLRLKAFRDILHRLARERNLRVAEVASEMQTSRAQGHSQWGSDGIHLDFEGYRAFVRAVLKALDFGQLPVPATAIVEIAPGLLRTWKLRPVTADSPRLDELSINRLAKEGRWLPLVLPLTAVHRDWYWDLVRQRGFALQLDQAFGGEKFLAQTQFRIEKPQSLFLNCTADSVWLSSPDGAWNLVWKPDGSPLGWHPSPRARLNLSPGDYTLLIECGKQFFVSLTPDASL